MNKEIEKEVYFSKSDKEITQRLVIRESDVRDINLVIKIFRKILLKAFGVAYIEVIKE